MGCPVHGQGFGARPCVTNSCSAAEIRTKFTPVVGVGFGLFSR